MTIDPTAARLAAQGVAFAPQIAGAARVHGLDPELLAAVAAQETGGPGSNSGRNVVGDGGHGHGIFQIDDRWHAFARSPEAMDPASNADYAATMLSGLLHRYGGDLHEALSAYNAGSPRAAGTRTTWSDGDSLGYADSVLRHYSRLVGQAQPDAREQGATGSRALRGALNLLRTHAPALFAPGTFAGRTGHAPAYHRASTDYAALLDDNDTDS